MSGWIGVDLDGTLAVYDTWRGADVIGEPVQPMVERVKNWLLQGIEVRIFTARVYPLGTSDESTWPRQCDGRTATALIALQAIKKWCEKHIGQVLPVTCIKDYSMIELWDDRAVTVLDNQGQPAMPGLSRL